MARAAVSGVSVRLHPRVFGSHWWWKGDVHGLLMPMP
jgi:hypothetical protein